MSSKEKLPNILIHSLTETHLKPIHSLQKYSNSTLFERRAIELKEKELKKSHLVNQVHHQPITKHSINPNSNTNLKSSVYLTDNIILNQQKDLRTSSAKETKEASLGSSLPSQSQAPIQGTISQESPLYLLSAILNERKQATSQRGVEINPSLEKKIKAISNNKLPNIKDFINKTREIVLIKYTSNIKRERAIRLKETYENEIQAINEKVTSLEDARHLFNENFFQKFGEYVKYLGVKREEEKDIDNGLIGKINDLKGQIMVLQNKTKKIQTDQAGLNRWMYFQIKVKEKKKVLPSYYQLILNEYSDDRIMVVFEREFQLKIPMIKGIESILKKVVSKRDYQQQQTLSSSTRPNAGQQQQQSVSYTNMSLIAPFELNAFKDNLEKEKERIMIYKTNPVYRTAEDFEQELKRYENENLKYINEYNAKTLILTELQTERETLVNELIKEDKVLESSIGIKEKQLVILKERHKNLLLEYALYKDANKNKQKTAVIKLPQHRSQGDILKKSIKPRIVHSKLYNKITEIYITAKQNVLNCTQEEPIKKTLESNEELEMMNMLKFIEKSLVILVDIYKQYSKKRKKELKEIEYQIEKCHKQRKSEQVKELESHRLNLLKQKIEERNNKIYFLPMKKVDSCYSRYALKGKKNMDNKTCGDLKFEDFMFDVLDA